MSTAEEFARRVSKPMWFDGTSEDADGKPVRMYSVVTPVELVLQHFDDQLEPISLQPGTKLVIVGAADGDPKLLWLEIDDPGHRWVNANVVLAPHQIRYLCEAGDAPHMKAPH